MIKLIFKKVVTLLLASFALSKNKQNFRSSQTHNSFARYELNYRYFRRILLEISFVVEHISVAASWNNIIVSTLSLKIGLIQTFLSNILDSQKVSQKFCNTVSFYLLKLVTFKTSGLKILKLCVKHFSMFQCLKLQVAYIPKYHWGIQPVIFFCS